MVQAAREVIFKTENLQESTGLGLSRQTRDKMNSSGFKYAKVPSGIRVASSSANRRS